MAQLIKNIEGSIQPYMTGNVFYITTISGIIQEEDYINLYGFVGLLQNLKQTEYTAALTAPLMFGLPNLDNTPMVTIQIDY
jgi:hypothetical protein